MFRVASQTSLLDGRGVWLLGMQNHRRCPARAGEAGLAGPAADVKLAHARAGWCRMRSTLVF